MMQAAWSFLMLLVVLAAIPASLWLLKRLQGVRAPAAQRAIEVTAQASLGPRERIVIVNVQGREFVLGVTAQQITLLSQQDHA